MRARGVIGVIVAVVAMGLAMLAAGQKSAPVGDTRKECADPGASSQPGTDSLIATRIERKPIAFDVRYELSRTVGAGRIVKKTDGKDGEIVRTFAVHFRDGKPVSKELVKTDRTEPVSALFLIGRQGFAASRGSYSRGKVVTMQASAYDPSAGRGKHATGRTSIGMRADYGIIAVDPRVIPYGTMMYVEGYGLGMAADTGSAIKGNRIDLCYPTRSQAMKFGRRDVKVHLLK